MDEKGLLEDKYWNELLQTLTGDENFKIKKTEIDSLLRTDTIDFYQHLEFFEKSVENKFKRLSAKNGKG